MTKFPQCFRCRHYHEGSGATGEMRCDAYPGPAGIPAAITTNKHDHRKPYAGDGGVLFEPRPEVP